MRTVDGIADQLALWERDVLDGFLRRSPEERAEYRTSSGLPLQRVYTPLDTEATSFEDVGLPGAYPFTRGPYPTMYRGRR
ncbi:MAG: methylmalonyl-CoA mutase family protein, partial [Candidatus Dormibacteria bacterium]